MILVGNVVGFVMLFVTFGICAQLTKLVGQPHSNVLALVLATPVLIALDLMYRRYRKSTPFGRAGGRLFFVPAWLFGVVLGVAGVLTLIGR